MSVTRDFVDNYACVSAFLAMAVKEGLMLNGRTAAETWDAHCALLGLTDRDKADLFRQMTE